MLSCHVRFWHLMIIQIYMGFGFDAAQRLILTKIIKTISSFFLFIQNFQNSKFRSKRNLALRKYEKWNPNSVLRVCVSNAVPVVVFRMFSNIQNKWWLEIQWFLNNSFWIVITHILRNDFFNILQRGTITIR